MAFAFDADDLRVRLDVGLRGELLDQVVRHARASDGPRTISVTLRAKPAKNIAAWPAELPPPIR